MMKRKSEKGFTLIEIIVAITLLSVIGVSLIILFTQMFGSFRDKNLESEVLVETQTLNNSLKDSLKSCTSYELQDNVLEIQLTKGTSEYWYYYIVDTEEDKAYLLGFSSKQDDPLSIVYDETDFIARYIESISIYPTEFDSTEAHTNPSDYLISSKIFASVGDITHTIEDIIMIRNGH